MRRLAQIQSDNDQRQQGRPPAVVIACHAWIEDQLGGAFKVASDLAARLATDGHRVCFVCGTSDGFIKNPTVSRGVELWRYTYPAARSPNPANLWGHVRGTYRITREIARTGSVQCVNGHTPLQFLGASLALGASCPRQVYTVHSPFDDELRFNWTPKTLGVKQRLALWIARSIEGHNCRRATLVQTLSHYTLNALQQKYAQFDGEKGVVCPGWVDTDRFRSSMTRAALREQLGSHWQTDKPLFFTLRRLEPRMGLDRLLDAAGVLKSEGRKFRLMIGGAGSLRTSLREQARRLGFEEDVFFLGRVPEDQLSSCFAAADCFVLPSNALECFGLIILEAYACGTPVIGTPIGAIPELIAGERRPWLTNGTSSHDIAQRMRDFLDGRLKANPRSLQSFAEGYGLQEGTARLAAVCLHGTAPVLPALSLK